MSFLISQQNKELLWGILAEEGIFDAIPSNVTLQELKHIFERILKNLSANVPALHAGRLKELYQAKQQAVADEDYDTAKRIHAKIIQMDIPVARLEKLEQRKQMAIQAEDYESAKQVKSEIDRIRLASFSLKELNKVAIQSLVVHIPKIANDISASKNNTNNSCFGGFAGGSIFTMNTINANSPGTSLHASDRNVQEIYNAEDFHSRKRQEIETKLREKEAETRAFLDVPRPQEIDFSDKKTNRRDIGIISGSGGSSARVDDDGETDSPLANNSDDMEKMIAERIAARQRDLDEITERMKASNPQPSQPTSYTTNDLDAPIPAPLPAPLSVETNIRKVRFQEDAEQENSILMKLKRKPTVE